MTALKRFPFLVAVFAVAIMVACSDDDSPSGGGPPDTTAPSVASVTAIDANHIDVAFNENVTRTTAEDIDNYVVVETSTPLKGFVGAPGDSLIVGGASLNSDNRTVSLTTSTMSNAPYDMSVIGVKDASGNAINTPVVEPFTGSIAPDITPPEVVYRSPGPGATGVSVGTSILITFTEPISYSSFVGGVTLSSTGGDVFYSAGSLDEGIHVTMVPNALLELATEYTINMTGVQDAAGNTMADLSWTFRTTNTADTTPPTLVSSSPANNAVNVVLDVDLSLTFSEPINQELINIASYPEFGDGSIAWSNGGKTLTFTPTVPLTDDTQYTISALPGSFQDLSGNLNEATTVIRFSTGPALEAGSFAGTMSGHPGSTTAGDPTGARVFGVVGQITTLEDLQIAGSAIVAGNNTFTVGNLADGDYSSLAIKDSNGDGSIDPTLGDALGAYGVDFVGGDPDPDVFNITGGAHVTGIDFRLFDFSAISGSVSYTGAHADENHALFVGLFDKVGFTPASEPVYGFEAFWPDGTAWSFWQLDTAFPDGDYYVGAFLDANDNLTYDAASDPAGFFGGLPTPTTITVANGSDTNGIVIPIVDPLTTASAQSVAWRKDAKHLAPAWIHNLSAAIKKDERAKQW